MRLLRLSVLALLSLLVSSVGALSAGADSGEASPPAAAALSADVSGLTHVEAAFDESEGSWLASNTALKAELFAIGAFLLLAHGAHHSARKSRKAQRSG